MPFESPVFTMKEAAEYLKSNESTMYSLAKSKGFPAFKVGGRWKIHKDKLDKWILDQIKNRNY
ncbi:helix-turn-helix domain-containing protein [Pelosinus propionicus]|uniref:DNA binding domain-containing protein, excisionase family n=1 Tax=Pelosinus propionicus DSM 13327 TaxID=1123291 RepID=A0A1I4JI70_9FIRM|nr:helix-turn-helix domain-containing protein [Pelosinus propionicus]SFL65826.1 DNA binding domain-containing protein, excisionase family [Pelosinus propionicus DSM 13327]